MMNGCELREGLIIRSLNCVARRGWIVGDGGLVLCCFCSSHDTKFSKALWEDTLILTWLLIACMRIIIL
jgi:hypothetical protein